MISQSDRSPIISLPAAAHAEAGPDRRQWISVGFAQRGRQLVIAEVGPLAGARLITASRRAMRAAASGTLAGDAVRDDHRAVLVGVNEVAPA